MNPALYFTRDDLRARGWAPKAIKALHVDHVQGLGRAAVRYLYDRAKIEAAEAAGDGWKKRAVTARAADPNACDILAALWAINRRAKRARDLAQQHYRNGMHGLAGTARQEKENLYRLKGQCLAYLLAEGRLTLAGYHKTETGLWMEILKGAPDERKASGYTYHRPCAEPQVAPETVDTVSVEAKPKDKREPRLKDALACVEAFLRDKPTVEVYSWPPRQRVRRMITCYNCGQQGHIAAECPEENDYDDFEPTL